MIAKEKLENLRKEIQAFRFRAEDDLSSLNDQTAQKEDTMFIHGKLQAYDLVLYRIDRMLEEVER